MAKENHQHTAGGYDLVPLESVPKGTAALEAKSFEMLSLELGLTYKGVCAIYYRAVQKIKNRMKGGRT